MTLSSVGTPVARHLPALEHVTGEGVVTDGTTGTMHLFTTVRVLGALEVPAAHDALVPLTEARTSYFNLVAGGEHVRGQHGAHFVSGRTVEADFANLAVTLHRLGHMLFLGFFEGDLQSVVAVRFSGLDLGNRARTSLNNRHSHGRTVSSEDAGHAKLATQNSHFLSHDIPR